MQATACLSFPVSHKVRTFHIPIFVFLFIPKVIDLESVRFFFIDVALIIWFKMCVLLAHSTRSWWWNYHLKPSSRLFSVGLSPLTVEDPSSPQGSGGDGSLLVWHLPFDLFSMGDPASSYATAGIALRVVGVLKPPHHDKVETPRGGCSGMQRLKSHI